MMDDSEIIITQQNFERFNKIFWRVVMFAMVLFGAVLYGTIAYKTNINIWFGAEGCAEILSMTSGAAFLIMPVIMLYKYLSEIIIKKKYELK